MATKSKREPEASLMYVVCCRCKELLDPQPGNLGSVSHGLCPKCYKEAVAEHEKSKHHSRKKKHEQR
jgi:hypothetical protein